jgi:predicted RNase H-like nuclease (RuvC/YqgF family)
VQKHEAEIRNHIRTEQQLRLYIENLETEEHIKNAQIENLNEKVNRTKRENEELKELLELHKRELSITRKGKFKKADKALKGSLPQVKKALTNSQGSIVSSCHPQKEFVRYLKKNRTGGGGGSVSSTRGEMVPGIELVKKNSTRRTTRPATRCENTK